MPLYELFCLTKNGLGKRQLADIIKLAGRTVIGKGGVITDVKSFGEQPLAYEIRKSGELHSLVRIKALPRPPPPILSLPLGMHTDAA
jgi:small subunit ribosomal protein S6